MDPAAKPEYDGVIVYPCSWGSARCKQWLQQRGEFRCSNEFTVYRCKDLRFVVYFRDKEDVNVWKQVQV
jgi:hypothetical protein